jgi:hypothetical protein
MIRVEVCFRFQGAMHRLPGVTQWTDRNQVAGIRFLAMSPRRLEALAEVLSAIEAGLPAATESARSSEVAEFPEPAGSPSRPSAGAVVQLPQEAAHRGKAEAAQALAPTPRHGRSVGSDQAENGTAAETSPSSAQPKPSPAGPAPTASGVHARAERRSSLRYAVDTSVVVHLLSVVSRIPGSIEDLSLGGCRVHTEKPFPVGIFRRVEAEFRLHGLPFRLAGVTQSLHDRTTVGIRFLDMSARKRAQLEELIAEIEAERAGEEQRGPVAPPESASDEPHTGG